MGVTMAGLDILPEDDYTTPCTNDEDIFTLEPLEPPLVKVRVAGRVFGYDLAGLARWLTLKTVDPVIRSACYTEDQVLEIRDRFGYFTFCASLDLKELVDEIRATKGRLDLLVAVFGRMTQRQLSACLFAAHRTSFKIFRAVFKAGREIGIFDLATVELFLALSTTDFEDPDLSLERRYFTLRLVCLFKWQLDMYWTDPRKLKQTIGHFVECACAPALRQYLLHFLVVYSDLIPRKTLKVLRRKAKWDTHLRAILAESCLIAEGLAPIRLAELPPL